MNLIQVTREFATEDKCLDYLERSRWPEGVRCPTCGGDKVSRITRKSETKNKRNRFYACLEPSCKQRFSATAGTIFHGSHIPLRTWFLAITIVVDAKKGVSALQLQQHLGIGSYRTAWYMVHRIRKAMEETGGSPFSGIVEVDETYIGGKTIRRSNRGNRQRKPKDVVIGFRERGGRVKFVHIPDAKAAIVRPLLEKHISPDATAIVTDESVIYPFALSKANLAKHQTINHSREYVRGSIHTNTVESAFSLLKRGIIGSFHKVSIKHLHRYLSEFEYRFNAREEKDRFERTVARLLKTDRMQYRQLIAETQA